MDALNIVFGVVGVLSLIYAVWANRQIVSSRQLTERMMGNIRKLARRVLESTSGSPAEGYAMSIIEITDSLLGRQTESVSAAALRFRYLAFALPMRSGTGVRVEDKQSWYQLALKGDTSQGPQTILHGPYERLPFVGMYRATFGFRVEMGSPPAGSASCAKIDVRDNTNRTTLAERDITFDQVKVDGKFYEDHALEFAYNDLGTELEYRIFIDHPGLTIWCSRVAVSLIAA